MKDIILLQTYNIKPNFCYALLIIALVTGCATSSNQLQIDENTPPLKLGRVQSQSQDGVTVHISIPPDDYAKQYFGVEMAGSNIQPIWVKIENNSDTGYWLLPYAIDPNYYSANEAAMITGNKLNKDEREASKSLFRANVLPFFQKANSTQEGFVYASYTRGGRFVDIQLTGHLDAIRMRFAVLLPTQSFDYEKSGLREMYAKVNELPDLTITQLRTRLKELPCCTTKSDGLGEGDPINIVLIGTGEVGISALSASDWDFTEAITIDSIRRTIGAAIEEVAFPTAPISSLYAFGRKQDVALQRGRSTISQRNHMRLWLAPFRCQGQPVWVGQISRDIGVKFTSKSPTLTTHIIDPVVDEAREYLLHSLLHSQSVKQFAFVKGMDAAWEENPRTNLTDDPYITDGMRMAIWLSSNPVPSHQAINLGWNESADPALEMRGKSLLEQKGLSPMVAPLLDP
jgi:hypothetical protein